MLKKTVNISLNELKSIIKKEVSNLFEDMDFFYSSYESDEETLEYIPGENSDLTDEEYEILQSSMLEEYPITFRKRGNGNDNYNDPYGYEIETYEDDVDKVYADIETLQPKELSDKILDEFNEWLSDKNPFE